MAGLPAVLNVAGRRCVVVGAGRWRCGGRRRCARLCATVRVIGPAVKGAFDELDVEVLRRGYQRGDLAGAFLVVAATDDPAVNEAVAAEARATGVLVNRADEPAAGDFSVPAHERHGPVTVAVDTDGISATAATAIRRELSAAMDADWPRLLEVVRPYRRMIQEHFADHGERLARLAQLTEPEAMRTLKQEGPEALKSLCERLADPKQPVKPTSD